MVGLGVKRYKHEKVKDVARAWFAQRYYCGGEYEG